eukprot:3097426-Prymnesium_polylepis.1
MARFLFSEATYDVAADWLCSYVTYGCLDPAATNYLSYVEVSLTSMCQYSGCNDTEAKNYDSTVRLAIRRRNHSRRSEKNGWGCSPARGEAGAAGAVSAQEVVLYASCRWQHEHSLGLPFCAGNVQRRHMHLLQAWLHGPDVSI